MSNEESSAPEEKRRRDWKRAFSVLAWAVVLLAAGIVVYWAFRPDSSPEWTGFGAYDEGARGPRAKTIWDWMELLIIPVVLAVGALLFNASQKKTELAIAEKERDTERQIARDRQRQATLEAYYDRMADLLLNHDLRGDQEDRDEARSIARARTLAVLRSLDSERKGRVIRFLHESRLIRVENTIVDLHGADLREADLHRAMLRWDRLRSVDLTGADLVGADLTGADLRQANLTGANLRQANLRWANLAETKLIGADLRWTIYWSFEQLQQARALENATMPGGTRYEDWIEKQRGQQAQAGIDNQVTEEEEEE